MSRANHAALPESRINPDAGFSFSGQFDGSVDALISLGTELDTLIHIYYYIRKNML